MDFLRSFNWRSPGVWFALIMFAVIILIVLGSMYPEGARAE